MTKADTSKTHSILYIESAFVRRPLESLRFCWHGLKFQPRANSFQKVGVNKSWSVGLSDATFGSKPFKHT